MDDPQNTKAITGYCEPLSLRAGESVRCMASSHTPGPARLDLVRIICGDPTRSGPGFKEIAVPSDLPTEVVLTQQRLQPGSYGEVDLSGFPVTRQIKFKVYLFATRPDQDQTLFSVVAESGPMLVLMLSKRRLVTRMGKTELLLREQPLQAKRWYQVEITADLRERVVTGTLTPQPSRSPGQDIFERFGPRTASTSLSETPPGPLHCCLFAASSDGAHFDGRLARPALTLDATTLEWDFSKDMGGRQIVDVSGNARHGLLHQLPARAVTGPDWDGSHQAWTSMPSHYDAIHFHTDDVYDAGWPAIAELTLLADLASGIYAFRLRTAQGQDRVPFFVRPARQAPTADVALLMSSCTYMAYANHRMLFEGADFIATRSRLRPEHEYLRHHPEVGRSTYEKHTDGSGVMFSSRRRPVLQLRPGADGWNFTPDTDINAFLDHLQFGHDILADEDVHAEGIAALAPYRVIVTGTHPEYWSTRMLDALEEWLRRGGRLMYLGGNGFYWRVALSDAWPGAVELRRAEDGVRNWQTEPGESYHAFTGEYGGLWRRLGRAPNTLVGVGFAAQGFERAIGYKRSAESYTSRAAWIFSGVPAEEIGTSGLGGGAAGQEVDRYSQTLGSPAHTLILASATEFGPDMTRTKEELQASTVVPSPDPVVRADLVFFETPAGGAVFSVGSISWFGALARNGYDNDIAQITANVVRRFADPLPFSPPESGEPEQRDAPEPLSQKGGGR